MQDFSPKYDVKIGGRYSGNLPNVALSGGTATMSLEDGSQIIIADSIIPNMKASVAPDGTLQTASYSRLVGAAFDGDSLDTNFWTSGGTSGGTITVGGEVDLKTNTTANGSANITSTQKGRFIVGFPMEFKTVCEFHTTGDTNNLRRLGIYDDNDGFYFVLSGATFGVGSRTSNGGTTDSIVYSGNFNGDVSDYTINTSRYGMSITYTNKSVYYMVNGVLIHTLTLTHDNHPKTFTLPIRAENINVNGNTTNNELHISGMVLNRIGNLNTTRQSIFQSGTIAERVCKKTAGTLHVLVVSSVVNNAAITLYDNSSASGTVIWESGAMGSQTQPYTIDFGGLPFNDGLTLKIASANCNVLVVYE